MTRFKEIEKFHFEMLKGNDIYPETEMTYLIAEVIRLTNALKKIKDYPSEWGDKYQMIIIASKALEESK